MHMQLVVTAPQGLGLEARIDTDFSQNAQTFQAFPSHHCPQRGPAVKALLAFEISGCVVRTEFLRPDQSPRASLPQHPKRASSDRKIRPAGPARLPSWANNHANNSFCSASSAGLKETVRPGQKTNQICATDSAERAAPEHH